MLKIMISKHLHIYFYLLFQITTMKQIKMLLITAFIITCYSTQAQTIITVAGSGSSLLGDGGPATDVRLGAPYGIAVDASGNLFIADQAANRVRKVNSVGIISTAAGNGLDYETGDGGPATAAIIGAPYGLAFDGAGNLYIAAVDSNYIRKISTTGIITTIAGGNGIVYGGDGGPATAAGFHEVYDVVADNRGNIYVSDLQDSRIRKIDANGIISTYAGTGVAGYNGDHMAATTAQINLPRGLAVDDTGNVYVCDFTNNRIRKIDTFGMITTIAGDGGTTYPGDGGHATATSIHFPQGIATDHSGNIYITNGYYVRKVNTSGVINTIAGCDCSVVNSGDGGLATAAELDDATGIRVGADGSIYISDIVAHRVRKILPYVVHVGITSPQPPPEERELCVWPNPTGGAVTMQVNTTANEPVHVVVTNVLGQKVKELTITTNTATKLQIKQPGIYFINAHTEREHWVERVVVE